MDTNTKNDSKASQAPEVKKDSKPVTAVEGTSGKNVGIISTIVLVLVIIVVFAIARSGKDKAPELAAGCRPGDAYSQTTGKPCLAGEKVDEEALAMITPCQEGDVYNQKTGELCAKDTSMALKTDSSGYEATLQQFAGKLIMLNGECVAAPATLSAATGSRILVTNHSSATSTVSIQGRTETLEPYHYMTSVFKTAGDFTVTCNDKETATVTIK